MELDDLLAEAEDKRRMGDDVLGALFNDPEVQKVIVRKMREPGLASGMKGSSGRA